MLQARFSPDLSETGGQEPVEETKKAAFVRVGADWDTMTDQEKLAVWDDWRKASDEKSIPWLRQARRSFRYAESDQVPDALRGKLEKAEGRMLWLSLVGLRYLAHAHVGTLLADKPEPHFEGTEWNDTTKAAVASSIFDFTSRQEHTRLHATARRCAWDQRVCGMGFIKEFKTFSENVDLGKGQFEPGEVGAKQVDPEMMRLDPTSRPGDRNSLNYIIELEPVLLRDVVAEYGDRFADISRLKGKTFGTDFRETFLKDYDRQASRKLGTRHDEFAAEEKEDSGGLEFNRMVVKEHIHYVQKKRVGKVFQQGESGLYSHNPDMTTEQMWQLPEEQRKGYRALYRTERIIRYACKIDDIILQDDVTDNLDLPYGIFYGEEIEGYHLTVGDMYHLFHPVDLLNGLATNMVDNAVRSASSGLKYEKSALSPTEKVRLTQEGHLPNFHLEVEDGYFGRVGRLEQGELSEAVYRLWSDIRSQIFDYLSGNPKIQTGQMPYQTSGRGILALGQRADLQQLGWQTQIEEALTAWARLRWRNIQTTYTVNRLERITGRIGDKEYAGMKFVRAGDGTQVVGIGPDREEVVLLEDLSVTKFDLNITIRPGVNLSPDERRELAMFLYNAGAVPLEYLVSEDGLNIKNGEEWLRKRREEDEAYQMGQLTMKAAQANPQVVEIIKGTAEDPEFLNRILDAATPTLTGMPLTEDGRLQVSPEMMMRMRGGAGNGATRGGM